MMRYVPWLCLLAAIILIATLVVPGGSISLSTQPNRKDILYEVPKAVGSASDQRQAQE